MSESMAKCPKCGSGQVTVDFRYLSLNASQCHKCDHVDLPGAFLAPIDRLQAETNKAHALGLQSHGQWLLMMEERPSLGAEAAVQKYKHWWDATERADKAEEERDELLKACEVMDGALAIAATLASALKPLIPRRENLEPAQREQWQKVIDAIFAASDYATKHNLEQWGGKKKPEAAQ